MEIAGMFLFLRNGRTKVMIIDERVGQSLCIWGFPFNPLPYFLFSTASNIARPRLFSLVLNVFLLVLYVISE